MAEAWMVEMGFLPIPVYLAPSSFPPLTPSPFPSLLLSSPITFDALQRLCGEGRFGRALHPLDQTFIVISDSVLKQLDGLKVRSPGCN